MIHDRVAAVVAAPFTAAASNKRSDCGRSPTPQRARALGSKDLRDADIFQRLQRDPVDGQDRIVEQSLGSETFGMP